MRLYYDLIATLGPGDYDRVAIYEQVRYYCQLAINCLILMDEKEYMGPSGLQNKISFVTSQFKVYQKRSSFAFIPFQINI
jgi:hypothetical protein